MYRVFCGSGWSSGFFCFIDRTKEMEPITHMITNQPSNCCHISEKLAHIRGKKTPAILGVRRQDMPEWDILYIRNGRQTGRYIDHCGCTVYYELSLCDGSVLYWLRDPVPWAVHTPRASLPVGWLLLSVFTGAISCNNPGLVDTILLHKHQARIFYMHPAAHTCTNWIYQVRGSQLEMISLCAAVVTSVWENKCTVAKALFCTCPSERVLV